MNDTNSRFTTAAGLLFLFFIAMELLSPFAPIFDILAGYGFNAIIILGLLGTAYIVFGSFFTR